MGTLKAGVARVDITPPIGCVLIGFGQRRAESVHDPLYAKALVLDDGQAAVALVGCDVLTLGYDIAERARSLIREHVGLPAERVMLVCTHTHSGPFTSPSRRYEGEDPAYVDVLTRKLAGAVAAAWRARREARLGFARQPVQIGVNRREMTADRGMILGQNWSGPVDPNVDVLRVDGADGRPIATLFHHAAHPVVLGHRNLAISADYPGYACGVLEGVVGEGLVAMFAQGCCGNINAHRVGSTFEEARRLGRILGGAALQAAESVTLGADVALRAASRTIELPLSVPSVAQAQEALRGATEAAEAAAKGDDAGRRINARVNLGWAQDCLAAVKAGGPRTQPYEIQVLTLNRTAIVGLPGEVFVEIGLHIQECSPAERTLVLAYANKDIGFAGYVPVAEAFQQGGYEPGAYRNSPRPFALEPGCAALIEKEAVRLVADTLAAK